MSKLTITKERIHAWEACMSGVRWFLEKFPQSGEFADVYAALIADKRTDDAGWLADRVFAELDTVELVGQTLALCGADETKIKARAKDGDVVVTTDDYANAATTGDYANAATTGTSANAATTGDYANAATTGYSANAATTGNRANAATTGNRANAATTGYGANAATTGYGANAATTGDYANAATTGNGAIAASLGYASKAKAENGGAIVIVNRAGDMSIRHIFASKVGENGIKPGVWYELSADGKPVEVV
ncbi:MAG: hypothetical protein RJA36_2346 [Pseudomonadota bacterium]